MPYADRISQTVFEKFAVRKSQTVFGQFKAESPFMVSWLHYLILMRIENEAEHSFYEIAAAKSGCCVLICTQS